jgi:TonB family protein
LSVRPIVAISAFAFVMIGVPIVAQSAPSQQEDRGNDTSAIRRATAGRVQILSDTQGADLTAWLLKWHRETEKTLQPLIPAEANPPKLERGTVAISFKVLPNGKVKDRSMMLDGRSGYTALDGAAWRAVVRSKYPPLPSDFHGPYLELRAYFYYNMKPDSSPLPHSGTR